MKRGFTLVELSIVLVIIGLLIGGILAAQSMIETVKIQKTIRQISDYNHGTSLFVNKYNYRPGDFPKAVEMLGADNNGNGNGIVGIGSINRYTGVPPEESYFYQHLTKAGMVNFPPATLGTYLPSPVYLQVGGNTPELTYKGVGIVPVQLDSNMCVGNILCFEIGGQVVGNNGGDTLSQPGLNSVQTMALDVKLDDGIPNTGNFRSNNPPRPSFVNQNLNCFASSRYLTSTSTGCTSKMAFKEFGY